MMIGERRGVVRSENVLILLHHLILHLLIPHHHIHYHHHQVIEDIVNQSIKGIKVVVISEKVDFQLELRNYRWKIIFDTLLNTAIGFLRLKVSILLLYLQMMPRPCFHCLSKPGTRENWLPNITTELNLPPFYPLLEALINGYSKMLMIGKWTL